MKPTCIPVAATISAHGESGLTLRMQRHVDRCERCARELRDVEAVLLGLRELRSVRYEAPPEIVPRVFADIGPWVVPDPEPRRFGLLVATAAAIATAATAAAAGTAMLLLRSRHRAA